MKYYSYIDHHNLTVDELINFSPYNLKSFISELSDLNINNKASIISGLEDSVSRSYHTTIEKNKWLKTLLYKDFNNLKRFKIKLELEHVDYIYGFKLFLENYLRPIIPELVNYFIEVNDLKQLFNILNQSDLFSENCQSDLKSIIQSKIDYACQNLKEATFNGPNKAINYIKNYHFYEITNLYQPLFDNQLLKLYDIIMDLKSDYEHDLDHPILKFILQAQVAFNKSQVEDVAAKLLIDDNAENAKPDAFKETSGIDLDAQLENSKSRPYLIVSIVVVSIILFSIIGFSVSHKSEDKLKRENPKTKKRRKNGYDNRIQFYYSLKLMTQGKVKIDKTKLIETEITPLSNPYPKTFNQIEYDTIFIKSTHVMISNSSNSDLIVFKLIKGKDESIYIPKKRNAYLVLSPSDSLVFLIGNRFVKSKFSHFYEKMKISDIYRVNEISHNAIPKISIIASETKETLLFKKDIKISENVVLDKLSINKLYRDHYYRNNN